MNKGIVLGVITFAVLLAVSIFTNNPFPIMGYVAGIVNMIIIIGES